MTDTTDKELLPPPDPAADEADDPKESIWRRWRRDEREPEEEARKRRRRRDESPPAEEDEDREGFWDKIGGVVPDVVKRTVMGSFSSLFLSEDGLRQYLTDLRLPKEIVAFILQQAERSKREFMKLIANELRQFLENTNFYDELRRILTGLSFEIRTEVRFIPNDQQFVKPEVKNTVRVKRQGEETSGDEKVEPEQTGE